MRKEVQNQMWAQLPEQFKAEKKLEYDLAIHSCSMSELYARARVMEDIYGVHNLKSEPRWKVDGGTHTASVAEGRSLQEEWCRSIIRSAYPAAAKFLESIEEIEVYGDKPGFVANCGMAFMTFTGAKTTMTDVVIKPSRS